MCGIAGILRVTDRVEGRGNDLVLQMISSMQERGPDEISVKKIEAGSVGSCRLSLVDEVHGSQPVMCDCLGRAQTLAMNGEIYNFRDLRRCLRTKHEFRGDSDTEVLAHLWEEDGVKCLGQLNGMYAFCVVEADRVYLVRDRFGEKPLYYRLGKGELAFASLSRPLLNIYDDSGFASTGLSLDESYFHFETNMWDRTIYAGVREIPPGHYLIFDRTSGKAVLHRYYSLDNIEVEWTEPEKAVREFRELIEDSVRLRTDTDIEYGCYLSGGIDSAVIAGSSNPTSIFTASVKTRPYMDESQYVSAAAGMVNAKLATVSPTLADLVDSLVDIMWILEYPVTSLAALTQYLLSRRVAELGLKVMLSGIGADEYLGGYARHAIILGRENEAGLRKQFPSYDPLISRLSKSDQPMSSIYLNLIARSMTPGLGMTRALEAVESAFESQGTLMNRLAATDMRISLPPLLRMDDRINMAFGIESRSPFLDYRIVEYAFRLPDEMKARFAENGSVVTKYILREAFKELIPREIMARKDKVGFPSPVALWLGKELRPLVIRSMDIVSAIPAFGESLFLRGVGEDEFSRTSWQTVQWAAWYLLFVCGLSREEAKAKLVSGL